MSTVCLKLYLDLYAMSTPYFINNVLQFIVIMSYKLMMPYIFVLQIIGFLYYKFVSCKTGKTKIPWIAIMYLSRKQVFSNLKNFT